jgi:rhodanese-related sulfurtransferase
MRRRDVFRLLPISLWANAPVFAAPPPNDPLELVAKVVEQTFPDVPHITPQTLAARLTEAPGTLVILDVRAPAEFAVSQIPGAIWVDPGAKSTAGIVAAAGSLEGKTVVAYCSIGLRSARLLVRLGQALQDRGAVAHFNLRGGVFQWRNEQRQLVAGTLPTQRIHPYSVSWQHFLSQAP